MKARLSNSNITSILTLSMGTIGAQLVNFLGQLLITRIYLPTVLGEFTLLLSYSSLIVPISSLRMETKLVAAESDEEANRITVFSILLNVFISTSYLFFILINKVMNLGFLDNIGNYAYYIPLIIFTNGLRYVFISYSNYKNEYRLIGKYQFIRELLFVGLQVLFGLLWPNLTVIAILYAFTPLIGVKKQGKDFFQLPNIGSIFQRGFENFYKEIKKYKNHIFYQVPGQFANTFSYTIITLTIAKIATESDVAFYSFSVRILMIPLVLISSNLSKVYLKQLNSYKINNRNYLNFHYKVSFSLLGISFLVFSCLYILAPELMGLFFGEPYIKSGQYISMLCFMYAVRFVTSTLVGAYIVFNKQGVDLFFQLILCAIGISLYYFDYQSNLSTEMYLKFINISYGLVYLLNLLYITFMIRKTKL